jgi:hypothetical protein
MGFTLADSCPIISNLLNITMHLVTDTALLTLQAAVEKSSVVTCSKGSPNFFSGLTMKKHGYLNFGRLSYP